MLALKIKPGSIVEYRDALGNVTTVHASTCNHCQRITEFPSMRKMHEHVEICRGCMKLICLHCAGKPCRPWEQECERLENEERVRMAAQRVAWGCY